MPTYLGIRAKNGIAQTGFCQRCGWKYLRIELTEDDYIKGLLVCCYCHDPDQPQRYPAEPRAEGFPPLTPAPDQYPGPLAPTLSGVYTNATQIDLSWTRAFDDADLINQYFVYRSTNSAAYALIASVPYIDSYDFPNNQVEPFESGLAYSDDTVAPGNNYSYYVVAEAVDHRISPNSNVFSIFTQPPPATLAGFYNYTTSEVDLSWTMPPGWSPFVVTYSLFRSVNGGAFAPLTTVSGATTTFNDTTATSFLNSYQYYVVANFTGADSVPSDVVTAPTIVVQTFTSSTSFTPGSGFQRILATLIGGGAGGSSGLAPPLAGEAVGGGQGGGGGAYAQASFTSAQVTGSVAITIGAGGNGGALLTSGSSVIPNAGQAGGTTSFGSLLIAGGGSATAGSGEGSNVPGGTASNPGGGANATLQNGGIGGPVGTTHSDSAARPGGNTTLAGAGGAGGCRSGTDSGNVSPPHFTNSGGTADSGAVAGGTGGSSIVINNNATTGTYNGGNGNPGAAAPAGAIIGGSGGGGGGFSGTNPGVAQATNSIGGTGGAGGGYGGGGGGGGDGVSLGFKPPSSQSGGVGGKGAPGVCQVISYF